MMTNIELSLTVAILGDGFTFPLYNVIWQFWKCILGTVVGVDGTREGQIQKEER